MDLKQLIDRLKIFEGLVDEGSEDTTYFEVDGDVIEAALEELQEYKALRDRIEKSAAGMEKETTGQFIATFLREFLKK